MALCVFCNLKKKYDIVSSVCQLTMKSSCCASTVPIIPEAKPDARPMHLIQTENELIITIVVQ